MSFKFKTEDYIAMVAVVVPFCVLTYFQPMLALIIAATLTFFVGFIWLLNRLDD